jgi:hypothetical protein
VAAAGSKRTTCLYNLFYKKSFAHHEQGTKLNGTDLVEIFCQFLTGLFFFHSVLTNQCQPYSPIMLAATTQLFMLLYKHSN